MTATLDPAISAWTRRLAEVSRDLPGLRSPSLPERRVAERMLSDLLAEEFTLPGPDSIRVVDFETEGGLTVRRYRQEVPHGTALPSQLFLHGGGFSSGSAYEIVNDRVLRARAEATGVQFFSLEYRLAPEHPYPAAVEDAIAAFAWMVEQPGVDAAFAAIGGISAGAGAVASAVLRMRDAGLRMPVHQLLEVPTVSISGYGPSTESFAVGFGLDGIDELRSLYLPDGPTDAYASPLDVPDLRGLPRTLIMTAEFDPLRDAGEAYAARLLTAGVPARSVRGIGHLHGTLSLTRHVEAARRWQQIVDLELRARVADPARERG